MKKIVLVLLTVLLLIQLSNRTTSNTLCGCGGDLLTTDEERRAILVKDFNDASVVFSGEVVELDTFELKIKVDKSWKGESKNVINMITAAIKIDENTYRSSSCNYRFQLGKKYLVYAYETDGELKARACSRTKPIQYAEQEMAYLEEIASRAIDN